ncbi:hypothetical protein DSO57_1006251 [Entomophthora muscae]|uniref:Uncharacterized protein n=1 Tax=Entomophthora muscae TaxID=34485 RepID=A0ACC2TVG9_9FUNG|nr:hypothetical protein DSO57_1006251 [Entomophthora muscae]
MIDTSIAVGPQQLATANLRLLFLPAYLPFLNPIKEVFGRLKQVVKQGIPTGTESLFNLLQAGIHTLPAETVAKFYGHTDLFGNSAHVDNNNFDSGHVNTFNVNTIVK